MKNKLVLLLIALTSQRFNSQVITTTLSEGHISNAYVTTYEAKLIGRNDNGVHMAFMYGKFEYIKRSWPEFKQGDKIINSYPVVDHRDPDENEIQMINNKPIVFCRYYSNGKKTTQLAAALMGDNGKISPNFKLIAEIKAESKKNKGKITKTISEDGKLIVITTERPSTIESPASIEFSVIDSDLNEITKKSIQTPSIVGFESDIEEIKLFNDKIYFLSTKVNNDRKKKYDLSIDRSKLFCYDLKLNKLTEVSIGKVGVGLYDPKITFDSKGNVFCGLAYYNDQSEYYIYGPGVRKSLDGIYLVKLTNNLENILSTKNIEMKGQFKEDPFNFHLKDLVLTNDDNVFFLLEKKVFLGSVSSNGNGAAALNAKNYYNISDILIAHYFVNKDEWNLTKLNKNQDGMGDHIMQYSFASLKSENGIVVIVNTNKNDFVNNYKGDEKEVMLEDFNRTSQAISLAFTFDNKGKFTIEPLFKDNKIEAVPQFVSTIRRSHKEVIMYARVENAFKILSIVYE